GPAKTITKGGAVMSDWHFSLVPWLLQTLAVGGAVLLFASLTILLVRQPARRRQIGIWAVRAALLAPALTLLPSWILLPRPAAKVDSGRLVRNDQVITPAPVVAAALMPEPVAPIYYMPSPTPQDAETQTESAIVRRSEPDSTSALAQESTPVSVSRVEIPWRSLAIAGYAVLAGLFLVRFCLGHL